ncbi:MAG TPA: 3-phosphoshikimate 1-carboxyvinyltransferase [Clostridiales bacterium]|nr:3-phosphoshikimate 1-carboxyvinyltransferase [Clostridiales bacterium]HCG35751.1 3-phosphoshikimate 1-carboxyvinyltransferase [Clostridiales bacterium]
MQVTIYPSRLEGTMEAIASKSHMHRLLVSASLARGETWIQCKTTSDDIEATRECLQQMGADIRRTADGFHVIPRQGKDSVPVRVNCRESGSTYRFLLPVAGVLGMQTEFMLAGRLPQRPMEALWTELEQKGMVVCGKGTPLVSVRGQLRGGVYTMPGNISSQFISGLVMALPLLEEDSEIIITGDIQSKGYIAVTLETVKGFGIQAHWEGDRMYIPGKQTYISPGTFRAEGDWSNGAFILCGGALGGRVTCRGLQLSSPQGDKAICEILGRFGAEVTQETDGVTATKNAMQGIDLDGGDIPDLIPAIAVVAAAAEGRTILRNIGRLKWKESDRLLAIGKTLQTVGGQVEILEDSLVIEGNGTLHGGTIHSFGDHRIVMMGAIASLLCENSVIIRDAQAVQKSYPRFFEDFQTLGANIQKEEET